VPRYKLSVLGMRARSKPPMLAELNWQVARECNGGSCIRVAPQGEQVVIGDTKNPDGPIPTYSRTEWHAFVDGIRQGDFDGI
jgi:predicted secreted Zn-dependent protease